MHRRSSLALACRFRRPLAARASLLGPREGTSSERARDLAVEASSDESIRVKSASKPPSVSIVKKKSRKRHASCRCGNCSACNEPPCQHCDVCRWGVIVGGFLSSSLLFTTLRKNTNR